MTKQFNVQDVLMRHTSIDQGKLNKAEKEYKQPFLDRLNEGKVVGFSGAAYLNSPYLKYLYGFKA